MSLGESTSRLGLELAMPSDAFALKWTRRQRVSPSPPLQGEEYEIAKAESETQKERDKFTARLFRNVGNLRYPFLKDPFG
jgi:hypothetical protein